MNGIGRRNFLKVGSVATVTAAAGCLGVLDGGDGSGGGSVPGYEQYLATGDEEVFYAYADFAGLEELDESGGGGGNGSLEDIDEPLLAAPLAGIFLLGFGAGFTLASAGLGGLIQTNEESDLESEGEQVMMVNEVTVVAGDLDTDELDERMTSEPEDNFFAVQYEVDEEAGGYTYYAPTGDGEGEGSVFAIGEEELVAAEERSAVDSVIDAIDGDGRATGEFDEFEWLLETAGEGLIALGGYGPDGFEGPDTGGDQGGNQEQPDPDQALAEFDDANGVVSSIDFDEEEADATLAASFDDLSEDKRSSIESELESDRVDVSVDFDGGRVTASATYAEDVLDETTGNQE